MENWKPVVGFEGLYEVSDLGNVKRVGSGGGAVVGRVLRTNMAGKASYYSVSLLKDGKRYQKTIHTLVALAFLGPRPKGMQVNHIDHSRTNNALSNLEYVTPKVNQTHSVKAGRHSTKFTPDMVRELVKELPWFTDLALAKKYGVSNGHISLIRKGKTWASVTGITSKVKNRFSEGGFTCPQCGYCVNAEKDIRYPSAR